MTIDISNDNVLAWVLNINGILYGNSVPVGNKVGRMTIQAINDDIIRTLDAYGLLKDENQLR